MCHVVNGFNIGSSYETLYNIFGTQNSCYKTVVKWETLPSLNKAKQNRFYYLLFGLQCLSFSLHHAWVRL